MAAAWLLRGNDEGHGPAPRFEAACISAWIAAGPQPGPVWTQAWACASPKSWRGCPPPRMVLPRAIKMVSARGLAQSTHHRHGTPGCRWRAGLLADMAAFINSLGPVQWLNTEAIARSNFLHGGRRAGCASDVVPGASACACRRGFVRFRLNLGDRTPIAAKRFNRPPRPARTRLSESSAIACTGGEEMEILALPPQSGAVGDPARHPLPLRALARRLR